MTSSELRAPPDGLRGKTTPRLWTRPLRPLSRRTSLGYEVAEFADITGEPLYPWERWAVIHALELLPDRTFRFRIVLIIVARQNGKSHLKRTVSLWRMYMQPKSRVLGVAQELSLAREQWQFAQDTIHDAADLDAEWGGVRNVNGDESFWLANASRYKIKASNRRAGRGGSNDEVNIDELREQRDWKAWAALSKTTFARHNSQIWCMSNAGDDESVVLNQLRDSALSGRDPTIGVFEWSGEYDEGSSRYCELDDWKQIAQANPGLGYNISAAAIATAMTSDPAEVFRTEVLCQRVAHLDGVISPADWAQCQDPGDMTGLKNRVAACFDVAPDGQHATLAIAARLDDGRVRGRIAGAWPTAGDARAKLPALLAKIRPVAIGWYPSGPAAELAPIFRAPPGRQYTLDKAAPGRPAYIPLTGVEVCEACMGLAGLIRGRQILHPGDQLLNAHIIAARRLPSGDGWRFTRAGTGHVDAAYAFGGAARLALMLPEPRRAKVRLLTG